MPQLNQRVAFSHPNLRPVALLAVVLSFCTLAAQAQTFQVLHNFTGGRDGAYPTDGLTIDNNGNLYGTASGGGTQAYGCGNGYGNTGCGTVFKLARSGSGWILRPLYNFNGTEPGNPGYGVIFGTDGALYGLAGGNCHDNYNVCGDVFRLAPPPSSCGSFTCDWQETILHQFTGTPDGSLPSSRLIADSSGHLYGATVFGGGENGGVIYELAHNGSGWNENVIYSFNINGSNSEGMPGGQLAIDPSGNLYGAAECSLNMGCFYGEVWQLQPSQQGWNLNTLFQFNGGNGYSPFGVLRDSAGNLYGSTQGDGGNDSAAVYELSPSNGGWNFTQLYTYGGFGEDSTTSLVMDTAGNLYGVDSITGDGYVFKLTHTQSGWTFSRLHNFSGSDGQGAVGNLVLDSAGNLYGATAAGGTYNYGVIWEITQ